MSGILVYSEYEAKRNAFAAEKFRHNLDIKLVFESDVDFSSDPDFVVNRTNNYEIAEGFEQKGIRVFNPSSLTKLANDKQKCYEFMAENGIEIMPINYTGTPVVKKARGGKGGTEVFMLDKAEDFESGFVYQKPASDLGKDLRVWLIGGEIIASVLRQSETDFRSNFCLGGSASVYNLSDEERELVKKISSLVSYDYIGIDFVFNRGKIVFNEIEDTVGARMVYDTTDIDILDIYCEYIRMKLNPPVTS